MICFPKGLLRRSAVAVCLGMLLAEGAANAADPLQSGDFTYTVSGNSITITDYPTGATGSVVIPNKIPDPLTGMPVTSIGDNAFRDCTGITSVSMPSTVTTLGTNCFNNCQAMSSVTLPPTLTSIGNFAFLNCQGLTSITVPSGPTTIASGTFWGCSNLHNVTLPSTVIGIQLDAFRNCSALTSITIPPLTTTLGNRAFYNCQNLQTITIPALVSSIGTEVFFSCNNLTAINVVAGNTAYSSVGGVLFGQTLLYNEMLDADESVLTLIAFPPGFAGNYNVPVGVKAIGVKAFYKCTKLVAVTLPSSMLSIGLEAFSDCPLLDSVTLNGNAPNVAANAFALSNNVDIYYPASATGYTDYEIDGELYESPWSFVGVPLHVVGTNDPFGAWLSSNSLSPTSDPNDDSDGDGVSLLMAYALNLNPHANLSRATPQPVYIPGKASITYWSGAAGITYRLEWSYDLKIWYTGAVTVSEPENQVRTASVEPVGPIFYVRLAVRN